MNDISNQLFIIYSSIRHKNIEDEKNNIYFLKGKIYNKNRIIFHNKELEKIPKYIKLELKFIKDLIIIYLKLDIDKLVLFLDKNINNYNKELIFKILSFNKQKIKNINNNPNIVQKFKNINIQIYQNNCFIFKNYIFDFDQKK